MNIRNRNLVTNYMLLDGAVGILSWFLLLLFCVLILFFFMLVPNGQGLSRVADKSLVPVVRMDQLQLPVAVAQTNKPPLPVVQADKQLTSVVQVDQPLRPMVQAEQSQPPVVQAEQPLRPMVQAEQPPVIQAEQPPHPVVQAEQPLRPMVQQPPVIQAEQPLRPVVQAEQPPRPMVQAEQSQPSVVQAEQSPSLVQSSPARDLMQQAVLVPEPAPPVAGEASNQHLLGLSMCPGAELRHGNPSARFASSGLRSSSDPAYRNTLGQLLDCFQKQMQAIGIEAKTDVERGLLFLPPLLDSQSQTDMKLLPGSLAAMTPVPGLQKTVRFPLGEARLDPESSLSLTPMRQYLQQNPDSRILLQGHADRQGTDDYNLLLSQHRAQSAADFFATEGIHPERMILEGFGSSRPVDTNDSEAAFARNRRVEIKIFKKIP